jgi:glucose/arabinose dehydrogenase
MMKFYTAGVVILILSSSHIDYVNAQPAYPADFAQILVASGISNPTAMAFAPDGRIFVAEQAGKLRVIKNGALLAAPFIQLTVNSTGERGLIGIALDPAFSTTSYVYLYYTVPGTPAHNRVSRFTANGDVVVAGSESIILELDPLSTATNHNGGAMHFGPDGMLYVAVGENANPSNAQNLDTYHGKLLRINSDGTIPHDNPFTTGSEKRKRVWAYGLRNPYTFSIHPVTGRILVNDVGQGTWEEINDATAGGKNFGWPTTEGNFDVLIHPSLTPPIYSYPHGTGDGKGCAITGGTFFFPSHTNYPSDYFDRYFFQDLCNRWINTWDLDANIRASFATSIQGNSLALTVGNDGNLYYLSRTSSGLYKIIYNKTTSPYITSHPQSLAVAEGQSATFTVSSLGTTPFTYQWQKDGETISGATGSTLTINNASPDDAGSYTVIVSNSAGNSTSNAAVLNVIENVLPIADILLPTEGTTYTAGTNIDFFGSGSDLEDGILAAASFRWEINFHHNTHKHDQPPIHAVTSGSFYIPKEGEISDDVWYRLILTVTDSQGLEGKDSIDILPNTSIITLTTDPPGLVVVVDGQSLVAPVKISSVEGILRYIGVDTPQQAGDATYEFASWSNTSELHQIFDTPADDTTLVASFSVVVGVEEGEQNSVIVFPNPLSTDQLTIRISVAHPQELSIQLVNILSQVVVSHIENVHAGEHVIPLTIGRQCAGVYSLITKTLEKTIVKKLVITE